MGERGRLGRHKKGEEMVAKATRNYTNQQLIGQQYEINYLLGYVTNTWCIFYSRINNLVNWVTLKHYINIYCTRISKVA